MKSSSFININGDIKQNKFSIFIYILINFFQNIYYSLFIKKFEYVKFIPKKKKYYFNNNQSISRKLCGVFWRNVNWKIIYNSIGRFNICEIGAGDGSYFKSDILIKKKYIKKYQGFDVVKYKNWNKIQNKNHQFKKFNGINFENIISKNNNLFLSQSCLEHVKYDLKFFHDIKKKVNKSKKKVISIHCLPSPFCLFTYLTHGYRQYNLENLNKISKILGSKNTFVIKLGNSKLNFEHLKKTTIPLILKKKNLMRDQNEAYFKNLNSLIVKNLSSSLFMCSFIVLVSLINFSEKEKKKIIEKIFS